MLSKDIWPVAQFSRLSFDTTCLYVFAKNKLISIVKKVSFYGNPVYLKRPWHRYFPVNFAKFLRISFVTEHLGWSLLSMSFSVTI